MATVNGVRQELTEEQIQIITDELNKLEYQNISAGAICKLINEKQSIANPNPQGTIQPSTIVSMQEILELISWDNLKKLKKNEDGAIALGFLNNLGQVDLSLPNVQAAIADVLQASLISQDEVDTLNAKVAPIPDPNWQAQILGESKGEELLGVGYGLEGVDIQVAKGDIIYIAYVGIINIYEGGP